MLKRCFLLLLVLLATMQIGWSDNSDLTVNLFMNDCSNTGYCLANPGVQGSSATAFANFALINEPWSFNLTTPPALSWVQNGTNYEATFGYGGSFTMDGPDGLTFTGVITSGSSDAGDGFWEVQVNYAGDWSNGVFAEGTADVDITERGRQGTASLTSQPTVPEPSTFILLGSGLLGVVAFGRRTLSL